MTVPTVYSCVRAAATAATAAAAAVAQNNEINAIFYDKKQVELMSYNQLWLSETPEVSVLDL